MRHIHLIGIGGTGLSAIARVLLEKGFAVSGSDRAATPLFKAITAAGAQTFLGHSEEHINKADLVIRSSAIPDDNPEVMAALKKGIPVLKREQFLKTLTEGKDTIAVAGSHGKTTTTAMLIWVLDHLDTDPSFISGGLVSQRHYNAHAGSGPYFVIEADEYDYMFLGLNPKIAVITNIEHDHVDCFPTEEVYREAFIKFLNCVRPDGLAFLCLDDPETNALNKELSGTEMDLLGYGTSPDCAYQADAIRIINGSPEFKLHYHDKKDQTHLLSKVSLSVPGIHNVLNATAALGTIHQLGLPMSDAIEAIQSFTGAGRRFETLGTINQITIIDDYGHHPTEIAATLKAARLRYAHNRIWAVWQPHTFSRTQLLEKAFIKALNLADRVVVLPIYAAREENLGYSSEGIANALPPTKVMYIEKFIDAANYLLALLEPDDVAIVFSAGDAPEVSQAVIIGLQQKQDANRNHTA